MTWSQLLRFALGAGWIFALVVWPALETLCRGRDTQDG